MKEKDGSLYHYSPRSLDDVELILLLDLGLQSLQGSILLDQFVPQFGDLGLGVPPDLVEGGLQQVDPVGEPELRLEKEDGFVFTICRKEMSLIFLLLYL